ncbi:MAG: lysophospholipase [bacterium]
MPDGFDVKQLRRLAARPWSVVAADDGVELFLRRWTTAGERACKVLLCLHGLGGHGGGYEALGKDLAEHGIEVYAMDHRGHGLSGGRRGDVADFGTFMNDAHAMLRHAARERPGSPLFLLGESMGGIIAIHCARLFPAEISGLVLAAAGIRPNLKPSAKDVAALLAILLPSLVYPSGLWVNTEANWHRAAADAKRLEQMKQDPLLLRRVSPRLLLKIAPYFRTILTVCAPAIRLPSLILQGTADQLVSLKGAEDFHAKLASDDKTIKTYEGAGHGLFNWDGADRVIRDVRLWLTQR